MQPPGAENGAEVGTQTAPLDPWQLLDELPRIIVVVDIPSGRIEFANRQARDLAGSPLSGKLVSEVPPLASVELYQRALTEGEVIAAEVEVPLAPGGTRIFEVAVRAVDSQRVISSGVDITDRVQKLMEREKELEKAIQLRDDFIGTASHELRTPLTAILLHCARLKTHHDADQVRTSVNRIERGAHSINGLISNLLDVSRIQHGEMHLDPEPVNLREMLLELETRLRELSEQAGCPITVYGGDAHEDEIIGQWDRPCLETIVMNLLTNAFKYGRGKPIYVSLHQKGGKASVTVKDHGVGISEEDQAHIFEQFKRVGVRRHAPGLGLGLWIVSRIVTTMGGRIDVDSQPQKGASFTVELPL